MPRPRRRLWRRGERVSGERTLRESHTRGAIRARFARRKRHSYLSDFIYGGIDGAVTTFAVASGVAGAGLDSKVVLILGIANLVGDGFSMAAANYLGVRSDLQQLERVRLEEGAQIDAYPKGEREEVRQIFERMGIEGETLEKVVGVVTSDRERWIDVMLTEEHGLMREIRSPIRAASVTFTAFLIVGALPLVTFMLQAVGVGIRSPYIVSAVLTGCAFFLVGAMKCRFVMQAWWRGGTETLTVGGLAAAIAYVLGWAIGGVV